MLCSACEVDLHEERRRERDINDRRREERQRELAAMSYRGYIATEDWRASRDLYLWNCAHLNYALGCETCAAKQALGVYHKTLDGLGAQDELVLLRARRVSFAQSATRRSTLWQVRARRSSFGTGMRMAPARR